MPYIGHSPTNAGSFVELDDISSGFNGSTAGFTMQVGAVSVTPSIENLLICLDGVVQQPTSAFSISGSTITFTENVPSGTDFYGILMGQSATVGQGTITASEMAVTGNGTDGQLLKTDGDGTFTWIDQNTVTAPASGLQGNTLASGVTASSLTSVGTLTSLTLGGDLTLPQKIVHSGDTDTYLSFGTDSLSLYTGGTNVVDFIYGNIYIKQNNKALTGYNTSGGAKELIKINGSDVVQIGEGLPVQIGYSNATPKLEWFYDHSNGTDYKANISLAGNDLEIRGSSGIMEFYTGAVDGASSTLALSINSSQNATFAGNITQSKAGNLRLTQTATGSGESSLVLTANNSTGDSFVRWETNSTTFCLGLDNSDGDKFILSAGSDPHSNSVINIQPDGSSIAVDKQTSFGDRIDFTGKPNIGNRVHSVAISSGSSSQYNMNGAGGNCSGGFIVGACHRDTSTTADNSVCIYAHVHTQGANVYSAIIERNDDSDVTISHNGSGMLTCTNNGNSTVNFVVKYLLLTAFDTSNNLK